MNTRILENRSEGIYCPAGDFYVDPRGRVERALITHAHSDHARKGHGGYLCSDSSLALLRVRLGKNEKIEGKSINYEGKTNATGSEKKWSRLSKSSAKLWQHLRTNWQN